MHQHAGKTKEMFHKLIVIIGVVLQRIDVAVTNSFMSLRSRTDCLSVQTT